MFLINCLSLKQFLLYEFTEYKLQDIQDSSLQGSFKDNFAKETFFECSDYPSNLPLYNS
jgi:hypothetical protein